MQKSVESLYQELLELDEHPRLEAKRASALGDSIMQTVCAFANEPGLGGGWLLLGVGEPDETHDQFWVAGLSDADKLLNNLQTNCRTQFEHPVGISSQHCLLDGKLVISVFVPELEAVAKPCRFLGPFSKKNKKKTGAWRRGINGDYECSEKELEPILLAKSGIQYEQRVPDGVEWEDLDPAAIEFYRALRANVKPHAEELQACDQELLRALNLVKKQEQEYHPNLAGLILLGRPLALRRLLPAMRVDYIRIAGTQWVEDPDRRFETTLDLREPLIRLIHRLEAVILDDMPRQFRLDEGKMQREDQPLLPQKVVREAIINALMHRDYQVNQPVQIVRYSNRLVISNPGYSLKPEPELGEMGSEQRNPSLAAALYDLDFAETKGSGIRTMRRLLENAGLTVPVFSSDQSANKFTATYLLHQLLGDEPLNWLKNFAHLHLSDYEAKALLLVKATGAIDNAALRSLSGLDTLAASQVLRRLSQQLQLLIKGGNGPSTYYQAAPGLLDLVVEDGSAGNTSDLGVNTSDLGINTSDLGINTSDLGINTSDLSIAPALLAVEALPDELRQVIDGLGQKPRQPLLWPVILRLLVLQPLTAGNLAELLGRGMAALKTGHLNKMRTAGLIGYVYKDVINHPAQAYLITQQGKDWLAGQGSGGSGVDA